MPSDGGPCKPPGNPRASGVGILTKGIAGSGMTPTAASHLAPNMDGMPKVEEQFFYGHIALSASRWSISWEWPTTFPSDGIFNFFTQEQKNTDDAVPLVLYISWRDRSGAHIESALLELAIGARG